MEVRILECNEKKYEDKVYYQFLVCDKEIDKNEKGIPISTVNGSKPHQVGSIASLVFYRNKDFKLCVRLD